MELEFREGNAFYTTTQLCIRGEELPNAPLAGAMSVSQSEVSDAIYKFNNCTHTNSSRLTGAHIKCYNNYTATQHCSQVKIVF